MNVEWKCNLDWSAELCVPRYSFTRLDTPFAKNAVSKGYNFRCGPAAPQPPSADGPVLYSVGPLALLSFNADLPNISRQRTGPNIGDSTKPSQSALTLWSLEM